jgi:hypothetical protein
MGNGGFAPPQFSEAAELDQIDQRESRGALRPARANQARETSPARRVQGPHPSADFDAPLPATVLAAFAGRKRRTCSSTRSRAVVAPAAVSHPIGASTPQHADPFARMLIDQARVEGASLVTHDPQFRHYDGPIVRV